MGRRADEARLPPWTDAVADAGRERGWLLVVECVADGGRL